MKASLLVSQVGKVLSFCLIILMGNAGASSSSAAFEEETLRHGGNTLKDYILISQKLAQALHCHIKSGFETAGLIKLKAELTSKKRSVDFLDTFKNSTDIFVNTPAKNPCLTCKGGGGYAPRPNIQMGFVYNSDDNAIGFHLSLYPVNKFGCTTNDCILEGFIPFETAFVIKFSGQDPCAFNQLSGRNKLILSHVIGVNPDSDLDSFFYDDVASQKVRQLLWHTQNLEPFFMQTGVNRYDDMRGNAYDEYTDLFCMLLKIDPNADSEFQDDYQYNVDIQEISSFSEYWREREKALKGLITRAKQNPKIPGTEHCYDLLMRLIQFNPFNVRI